MGRKIKDNKYEICSYLLCGALSIIICLFIFRMFGRDWDVPIAYSSDALGFFLEVQNGVRGGSPYLYKIYAAPFGADYKYAIVDYHLYLWPTVLLAKACGSAWKAVNISFILTYLLTTWASFFVLRKLGLKRMTAIWGSVLYSFLPYHTFRNELHFTLSCIQFVPIMSYFALIIMKKYDEDFFISFKNKTNKLSTFKWVIFSSLSCLLMGLGSAYYSGFTCLLFAFAGVYTLIYNKSVYKFLYSLYLCLLILFTSVVTVLPGIIASLKGDNSFYGAARVNSDIDLGSMHIVSLFTPIFNHIIEPFGKFSEDLNKALNYAQEKSLIFMGGVMAAGLLFSIFYMLYNYGKEDIVCLCGKGNLFLLLVSVVGGVDSLIAMYVTSSIRGYNRTVVFIAFFSILSIGVLVDKVVIKYNLTDFRKAIVYILLFILGCGGVIPKDYSSIWVEIPHYNDISKQFKLEKQFIDEIESIMNVNDKIFELPIVTEDDINVWPSTEEQGAYNLYKPVINSMKTVWSQGGLINSRPYFWKKALKSLSIDELIPILSSYGFNGIYIDTNGYEESAAGQIIDKMDRVFGVPLVSSDGKLYYYDMGIYNAAFYSIYSEREIENYKRSVSIWAEFQTGVIQTTKNSRGQEIYSLKGDSKLVIGNIGETSLNVEVKLELVNNKKYDFEIEFGTEIYKISDSHENGEIILNFQINPGVNVVNIYNKEIIDVMFEINIV